MSKLDKDEVIAKFTEAYKSVNGKEPSIEAKGGWYSVDGGKNIRLAQLNEMIDQISQETKTEETKAESKPKPAAAKPKKAAAKPAAKKAKKKASSFSVKEFWTAKISENDKNSQAPR